MRPATRSGTNSSSASSFSPVPGELDRPLGHRAHRQRRAAARVAVHPRQDHAGQRDFGTERLRDVDRVLTGQAVDHQQDLVGRAGFRHRLHLGHQRGVDVEPPGGVEEEDVEALQLRRRPRPPRDIDRRLAGDDRQGGDARLLAQHAQLLLRRGPRDVERRHQHLLGVLLGQPLGELGGRRRLARPLQADDHDHGGRRHAEVERCRVAAEHLDQRVVDDLDDLLPRRDRSRDLRADRARGDAVDEVLDHRQRDVGLEQRDPHLAHRRAHVELGQRPAPAELVEHPGKPVGETIEHQYLITKNAPAGEPSPAGVHPWTRCRMTTRWRSTGALWDFEREVNVGAKVQAIINSRPGRARCRNLVFATGV